MGFGYLLIGYLITFVLSLTVDALGFGGLAHLAGYALMLFGVHLLSDFHKSFLRAKWLLVPLVVTAVYRIFGDLDALFVWELPLYGMVATAIYEWLTLALIVAFNLAMLYAIHCLATEVELPKLSVSAKRNAIIIGLYVLLWILVEMPFTESIRGYLTLPLFGFDLIWIFCNLFLLLSCAKNICAEGDEEQPMKQSKGVIGRLNRAYEQNRQRAVETKTRETEAYLRRRRERKEKKHKK